MAGWGQGMAGRRWQPGGRRGAHSSPRTAATEKHRPPPPQRQSAHKPEIMYAAAAGHALLGALCLWRGLAKEESWEVEFCKDKD